MWLVRGSVHRLRESRKETHVYSAMESKAEKTQLTSTVCCLKTRIGIVARSPCLIWMKMKTAIMRKKPSNVPQTLELLHSYVNPPHCSASSNDTIAQMRNTAPAISMCFRRSLTGRWLYCRSGFEKKKNTTARDTAPNGRLIQKHQRQLNRSVNAPPRIGPTTDAMPNMDESAAM